MSKVNNLRNVIGNLVDMIMYLSVIIMFYLSQVREDWGVMLSKQVNIPTPIISFSKNATDVKWLKFTEYDE